MGFITSAPTPVSQRIGIRLARTTLTAGQWDSGDTKRDKPVSCCTVEKRIRSGGKRKACTAREANAVEPRNRSEKLRGKVSPEVRQE